MLIPPGELYDPFLVMPWNDAFLLNDDGKAIGDHGSRLLRITPAGKFSVVMDADALTPVVAFDIAPAGSAAFRGRSLLLHNRPVRRKARTPIT